MGKTSRLFEKPGYNVLVVKVFLINFLGYHILLSLSLTFQREETLKQRGCRFGASEIYNVVEKFPEVLDSICVSQYNKDMDERAVLGLKLTDKLASLSTDLIKRIQVAISRELTVRHVPDVIIQVDDIPYNINGKKMEVIVKKILNGMPYNAETARNPQSLDCFRNRPELTNWP